MRQRAEVPELDEELDGIERYRSAEGFDILVGTSARANDRLTFRLARPDDFWLHVAATSGSHVVVRNPDNLPRLPRQTLRQAAALAAHHSKGRAGGRVAVDVTRVRFVSKARGAPAGQVQIRRHDTLQVSPAERPDRTESSG